MASERFFEQFDAFVAEHGIDLDAGPELGVGGFAHVHASQGFAVRRPKQDRQFSEHFAIDADLIAEYVENLEPGLGVPDLEQIQVASRQKLRTISTIVPGVSGMKVQPADLAVVTEGSIEALFDTLEEMDNRDIAMDGPGYRYGPSGNILIGPRIGFVDFAHRSGQPIADKLLLVVQTLLYAGNTESSSTFQPDRTYARPLVQYLGERARQRYGREVAAAALRPLR